DSLRDWVSDRVMREICRFADAYRRVAQSRICTTVYSLAQRSQWGVRPLLRGVASNQELLNSILLQHNLCSKYTARKSPIYDQAPNSCISFVLSPRACSSLKSAANCSSSNFIRADAPQYPAGIEWIKTGNKAEWKYDPDGRPGIWVSLFRFQQGFRPSHETNIAKRFPTFCELRQIACAECDNIPHRR